MTLVSAVHLYLTSSFLSSSPWLRLEPSLSLATSFVVIVLKFIIIKSNSCFTFDYHNVDQSLCMCVCVLSDRVKKISQTHTNKMEYKSLKVSSKEKQETQDNTKEMDLDRSLPGYGQFQDSTYGKRMIPGCLFCWKTVKKILELGEPESSFCQTHVFAVPEPYPSIRSWENSRLSK